MAYTLEIKQKALEYLDRCDSINEVATVFAVDRNIIRSRVKKDYQVILLVLAAVIVIPR